ncbi:substrate-binding domain-containing protein [Methylobacterium sp. JK268]
MTDPITGLSSMATRQVLADLAASYERRTGQGVAIRSMGGVDAARLVRSGAGADVIVLASAVMEQLEAEGFLVAGSRVAFARSGIAAAAPSGRPRIAIDDEAAVRAAVLGAERIATSTGPSGDHLGRLWQRWGIADAIAGRVVQAPPGVSVGSLLARGEADLGFQQLSELRDVPGIAVLGMLPREIQAVTVFSAGLGAASPDPARARALIAYLTSAEARPAKERCGLEAP